MTPSGKGLNSNGNWFKFGSSTYHPGGMKDQWTARWASTILLLRCRTFRDRIDLRYPFFQAAI
jgi:hypothetical protein